jgi:hypothetical protein
LGKSLSGKSSLGHFEEKSFGEWTFGELTLYHTYPIGFFENKQKTCFSIRQRSSVCNEKVARRIKGKTHKIVIANFMLLSKMMDSFLLFLGQLFQLKNLELRYLFDAAKGALHTYISHTVHMYLLHLKYVHTAKNLDSLRTYFLTCSNSIKLLHAFTHTYVHMYL